MPPAPPSVPQDVTPNPPSSFGSEPISSTPKSRKKLVLIVGTVLAVLIIGGTGLSVWAIQNHKNQLAAQAKLDADQKAKAAAEAKAREGTVGDLNSLVTNETKQFQDQNDRFIFNSSDSLKREADAADTTAGGNENAF